MLNIIYLDKFRRIIKKFIQNIQSKDLEFSLLLSKS